MKENEMSQRPNRRKTFIGTVVSDKMNKTRVVQVKSTTKHDVYKKIVRHAARFKAHDEKNESKVGDVVRLMETRPLSKDKRWLICEIIKKNVLDNLIISDTI